MALPSADNLKIGVIGLGYVGLPLAVYFAAKYPTIGFDIDAQRVSELENGLDRTREVTDEEFAAAKQISYTTDTAQLSTCDFLIVTVPTPIDSHKQPDLTALRSASKAVGGVLRKGMIVVFESTVYPGATEEVCVPIIEEVSGLKLNDDFYIGYSPERINPGDHEHRLPSILKVTSGSTPEAADLIDKVYASIITAGTHKASSVRVAEAAKVIENIQRDVNIALINELAQLFKKMGIESREVLEASATKWNFHRYQPGLVGGHCIGVDPYYLTHKAHAIGFNPEIILSGRRTNDGMAQYLAHDVVTHMIKRGAAVGSSKILVMGFTFKEDCPDIRNTKVADMVEHLGSYVNDIVIFDPTASPEEAHEEYGIQITNSWPEGPFDGIVLAVKHAEFREAGIEKIRALLKPDTGIFYDVKGLFPIDQSDARL